MSEGRIDTRRDGAVQWIILNNPSRLNAMSREMQQQFMALLDPIDADPGIRAVAVTGIGDKAFMSGGDLSQFDKYRSTSERMVESLESSEIFARRLRALTKPSVAIIRGWCVGGGISLALNCHLRICSDDARFFHAASKFGQGFAYDFTRQMVRQLGIANATELLLTCRRYSALEAQRLGIVNQVAPVEGFDAFAASYLADLTDKAPLSMVSALRTLAEVTPEPADADLALIRRLYVECCDSADYAEGGRAFAEKRTPLFTGR